MGGPPRLRSGRRICPLCEATCGLVFDLDGRRVSGVRPDDTDVFSAGHACAKGIGLRELENDPDRLTTPLVRRDGTLVPASWDEALAVIAARLPAFLANDRDSVGVYTGNPPAHSLDYMLYGHAFPAALGTRNLYSPASLDTLPQNVVSVLMYGTGLGLPVPDLDRTDFLLLLGTNPMVSNGSTVTAPGIHRRLAALRGRGGRLVVVDPVRTRTAEVADRHLAIRPGTDAYLLMGMLAEIARAALVRPGPAAPFVDNLDAAIALAADFPPEAVAPVVGVPAEDITALAREFATAPRAVALARIGTCAQEFGTLTSWLVQVLNIATGRLDAEGGARFATPPAGGPTTWPGAVRSVMFDRWRSRVRGLPEAMGELPAVCLAEEILTPGTGRIRALFVLGGNPARTIPNSARMERALANLEFLVCLDTYLNETTQHADVVLPAPPLTTKGHYDITLNHFAVRDVARYTPPLLGLAPGQRAEWDVLLRLAAIAAGTPNRPVADLDAELARTQARRSAALAGVPIEATAVSFRRRRGPERLLDLRLRSGPFGDKFGAAPGGLSLDLLAAHPAGIDFGPLRARLPEVLRTPGGRIDAAHPRLVADVPRLRARQFDDRSGLRLVNRRQRRGMNSWLHNALPHADAREAALLMHPADAVTHGIVDGERVHVESAVGEVTAEARVTDTLRPGVVSLPHGWGHTGDGLRLRHAGAVPGANVNALNDDEVVEPITGMPIYTGVTVRVRRAEA